MIIFSDFDGTISKTDLNDIIVKQYYGVEKQLEFEDDLKNNKIEHNIQLKEIFDNIPYDFNQVINIINDNLDNNVIDEYFKTFYEKCKLNNITIYIISGGFKQIIKNYLPYIPEDHIIANDFSNISTNTLDKNKVIRSIIEQHIAHPPPYVYIGDGISDFDVAKQNKSIDTLFVKNASILHNFCDLNNINYTKFSTFNDINSVINNNEPYTIPVIEKFKYKLTMIENEFPMCDKVLEEINNNVVKNINRYPLTGTLYNKLLSNIRSYTQCNSTDKIILTHGSDNALNLCAKSVINNKKVLVPVPNYPHMIEMIKLYAADIVYINTSCKDTDTDIYEKIKLNLNDTIDVCYISNPNLPFGYLIDTESIENLLITYKNTTFIIDEAYYEYGNKLTCIDLISKYNNIIVTRTFSKFFALANFRIGYLLTSNEIYDKLIVYHNYKDISNLSLVAATETIVNKDFYLNNLVYFKESVSYLKKELHSVITPQSFIYDYNLQYGLFFLIISKDSKKIYEYFAENDIYIRDKHSDITGANRITIGPIKIMEEIIYHLKYINKEW